MSISQIFAILKARWVVLLSVFVVVVAMAVSACVLLPKRYTSSAQVLIDVKSPDPMIGMVLPAMTSPSYMATQVDLLSR
jgi:succinoglycan biosynthesis transport protein ExoP